MREIISQLWAMPLRVLLPKIIRKCGKIVKGSAEEILAKAFGTNITDIRFCRLLDIKTNDQNGWIKTFRKNITERTLFVNLMAQPYEGDTEEYSSILKFSEIILKHNFDLLGSGNVKVDYFCKAAGVEGHRYDMALGQEAHTKQLEKIALYLPKTVCCGYQPIDWNIDFKSGYRWSEKTWFARIRFGQPGADIKVPWELSRFQHGVRLGQAYRVSGNVKYANEVICQIIDWIESNPVGYGPNWACPMDVAIRATNWLVSLSLVHDSDVLTDRVLWLLAKSLYQHGKHIRGHLEWSPQLTSNHYTSDIAGLFMISNICPDLPEANEWSLFSRNELEHEIVKQVYNDGCNFEASTCYHRLVTELFFFPALLAEKLGVPFSKKYMQRLEKMFDVVRLLLHKNGVMPQIGDNDSGRFITLENPDNQILKMDYLLPVADWFFKKETGGYPEDTDFSSLYWLSGKTKINQNKESWERRPSFLFLDSGWVVLRKDGIQAVVSCGPNGQNGNGGHAHNDKLSMEISVNGMPVIVDPGTYVYTSSLERRNQFRSTAYHSTPQKKEIEQNPILNGLIGAFILGDKAQASVDKFDDSCLKASHKGYGTPLKMSMNIHEKKLLVSYSADHGDFTMRWLLHPNVRPKVIEKGVLLEMLDLSLLLCSTTKKFNIEEYDYSPAYGLIVSSKMITLRFSTCIDWRISEVGT